MAHATAGISSSFGSASVPLLPLEPSQEHSESSAVVSSGSSIVQRTSFPADPATQSLLYTSPSVEHTGS